MGTAYIDFHHWMNLPGSITLKICSAVGMGLGLGSRCFVVRANEKLTAFVELERAIHEFAVRVLIS